jgi:hypothetical protein
VALSWLSDRTDDNRKLLALHVAGGAPLLAEQYLCSGFLDEREAVIRDVRSALEGRADAIAMAARWKEQGVSGALGIVHGILSDISKTAFVENPPAMTNPDQLDWLQRTSKRIHLKRVFELSVKLGAYIEDSNSPLDKSLVLEDIIFDLIKAGNA